MICGLLVIHKLYGNKKKHLTSFSFSVQILHTTWPLSSSASAPANHPSNEWLYFHKKYILKHLLYLGMISSANTDEPSIKLVWFNDVQNLAL